MSEKQKLIDFKDPYTWGALLVVALLILFAWGVVNGVKHIEKEKNEVKDNCPRTDLVVLGGHNGTPRWVYDCRDVDLKLLKR